MIGESTDKTHTRDEIGKEELVKRKKRKEEKIAPTDEDGV